MSIKSSYTTGEDLFFYKDAFHATPVRLDLRVARQTSEHLFARLVEMNPDLSENMETQPVGEIIKFSLNDENITDVPDEYFRYNNVISRVPLPIVDEQIELTYSTV